jgi:hypothetical protein
MAAVALLKMAMLVDWRRAMKFGIAEVATSCTFSV